MKKLSSFKHLIILTGDSTILTTKERSLTLSNIERSHWQPL
ncbi:hypothetical protein [Nostoc sp. NMS9]|nr:hypothetical protein [Nostoc sp. NMS9]